MWEMTATRQLLTRICPDGCVCMKDICKQISILLLDSICFLQKNATYQKFARARSVKKYRISQTFAIGPVIY